MLFKGTYQSFVFGASLLGLSTAFAGSVQKMALISSAQQLVVGNCSSAVVVQAQDGQSHAANVPQNVRVYFTGSSSSLREYSDASCSIAISSIVMKSGTSQVRFYFKGTQVGSPKLVVATYNYIDSSQIESIVAASSTPTTTTTTTTLAVVTTTTIQNPTTTTMPVVTTTTLPVTTTTTLPAGGGLSGRSIPSPIYGVTLDDVSNISGEVASLKQLAHVPTTRVVFDASESPSYYSGPISQLRGASYVMGQILDSSDMSKYTVASFQSRTQTYLSALGSQVDLWEIGNEINGGWLGNNAYQQALAAFNVVSAQNAATALTFFYEGEPSDPYNCIDTSGGGNDMFTWINQKFQLSLPAYQRDPANEKFRLGLNYVLISWYPDQCNNIQPNWTQIYAQLAQIFPNAKVGFGEVGTANPQGGSAYEVNLINQFYPLASTTSLPSNYIGGYFWWYYAEEMVPTTTTPLFDVLNTALGH